MGTIGRHPPTVHRRRLDGRRSRPKTPKDDRHVEGQGRTGLFGRRLLLDDLRTDYQPRRCQHGRPDGYGARTGRNRALQTRHRRKPPRDDVDRRQGGGRGHGVRHVQRIHQTHLRTARREQDHGSEDLRRGRPRRGRSGRRYLRRRMDRSRRRADRPETRRTAGLLRHLGSLPPLREVSRLVRQHRGGLHRPDRRPAGTHLPRHSGRRPPPVVLPARYDLRPIVLPADRPAQSRAGGQHLRLPRQRNPHVVQPRPDGEPTARRLHGRLRSARRETRIGRSDRFGCEQALRLERFTFASGAAPGDRPTATLVLASEDTDRAQTDTDDYEED